MTTTREFTKSEILDLLDTATEINSRAWRHGRRVQYVIDHDGAHWAFWLDVHHEDGPQIYDSVTATKVHQVEKTVKVWEAAP